MTEKEQTPMTEKESVRWRVANAHIDPDNYVFIPAKKQTDYYDNDIPQRVMRLVNQPCRISNITPHKTNLLRKVNSFFENN